MNHLHSQGTFLRKQLRGSPGHQPPKMCFCDSAAHNACPVLFNMVNTFTKNALCDFQVDCTDALQLTFTTDFGAVEPWCGISRPGLQSKQIQRGSRRCSQRGMGFRVQT